MKFVLACSTGDPGAAELAAAELSSEFRGGILGRPDHVSPFIPMPGEAYYAPEMGPGLVKRYLSYPTLLEPGALPDLKLLAMEVESRRLRSGGGRVANLDPGYVSCGGLVLSTGKCAGHRLYLGRGVWGELTTTYVKGAWSPLPWTYRDYRDPEVLGHLTAIRRLYLQDLRRERDAPAAGAAAEAEAAAALAEAAARAGGEADAGAVGALADARAEEAQADAGAGAGPDASGHGPPDRPGRA
jgi:hypothetical protein